MVAIDHTLKPSLTEGDACESTVGRRANGAPLLRLRRRGRSSSSSSGALTAERSGFTGPNYTPDHLHSPPIGVCASLKLLFFIWIAR